MRAAAFIFLLSACVVLPAAMRKAPSNALPAGNFTLAQVVFARPLSFLGATEPVYVLERRTGRVLGISLNESAFAMELEPGAYELCPAPNIDAQIWQSYQGFEVSRFLHTPLTRIEVAAGRRYLVEVVVDRGIYELVPARAGSQRELRLKNAFRELQLIEPVEGAAELQTTPLELAPWFENCSDSTAVERYQLRPDDGESPLPRGEGQGEGADP
ncbi:MAG: hypothetical protein JNM17_03570 [Archangium sp.]|nr:hypothetical protein [Archangium sp.]